MPPYSSGSTCSGEKEEEEKGADLLSQLLPERCIISLLVNLVPLPHLLLLEALHHVVDRLHDGGEVEEMYSLWPRGVSFCEDHDGLLGNHRVHHQSQLGSCTLQIVQDDRAFNLGLRVALADELVECKAGHGHLLHVGLTWHQPAGADEDDLPALLVVARQRQKVSPVEKLLEDWTGGVPGLEPGGQGSSGNFAVNN